MAFLFLFSAIYFEIFAKAIDFGRKSIKNHQLTYPQLSLWITDKLNWFG